MFNKAMFLLFAPFQYEGQTNVATATVLTLALSALNYLLVSELVTWLGKWHG